MIVRELLAVFGLDYDARGQRRAQRGMDRLHEQADMLQGAFSRALGAAAIAAPFAYLIKMASDAQENLNLLEITFLENAQGIAQWADATAEEIGRSRFNLRELAAEFGALLQPMVGQGSDLADMSKGLSRLAIDLESARNVPLADAMNALRSGLSGNVIALKRFGVNLNQTRVQQEAVRRGWSKNTRELTQAQLATLRYSLIVKDLAFIQDDAKNTQHQFAGSLRATTDALKDIGTEIGFVLLPGAEDTLLVFRRMLEPLVPMIRGFREFAKNTNIASAALLGIGVVIGALMLPLLFKLAPLIVAFAAFVAIMDDVITTFKGGDSVIRRFTDSLDELAESGDYQSEWAYAAVWAINAFRDALGGGALAVSTFFKALMTDDWQEFQDVIDSLSAGFTEIGEKAPYAFKVIWRLGKILLTPLRALSTAVSNLVGLIVGLAEAAATGSMKPLGEALSAIVAHSTAFAKDAIEQFDFDTISKNPQRGSKEIAQFVKFQGRGIDPAGLERRNIQMRAGDKTYNITATQAPGESSEAFIERLRVELDMRDEAADEALYREMVQAPAAGG